MRKSLKWSQKEDQLILSNISLITSKKWKVIANILKDQGFNKKQSQCRERYINYLSLSHQQKQDFTLQELTQFYQKYEELGPKWTQIQRFLSKRSQVQLKNIFYGNIRCFVKKVFKHFTNKTAVFVNKFDTFTLQNIYEGKKNYNGMNFIKEDIKAMNYLFTQSLCFSLIQKQEQNYKKLFKLLLEEEETKKSKHYVCLKKFSNSDLNIQKENSSKLKNLQNQVYFEEQAQRQMVHSSENSVIDQRMIDNNFWYGLNQQMVWNQQPYVYLGEQSWGNLIKPETMCVYSHNPQLIYDSYPRFPGVINQCQNQSFIVLQNIWN